jgi:hypothetical protein
VWAARGGALLGATLLTVLPWVVFNLSRYGGVVLGARPMAVLGFRRRPSRTGLILAAPVVCVALTSVVFYGSHRLRAPAEPAIVLCAAVFLASLPRVRGLVERAMDDVDDRDDRVRTPCGSDVRANDPLG